MRRSKKPRAATTASEPELVTIAAAAEMLSRKPMTVRRLIRTGALEARLVLHTVMVVKESVERLLRPRPYKPQHPAPPRRRPAYGAPQPLAEPVAKEATP